MCIFFLSIIKSHFVEIFFLGWSLIICGECFFYVLCGSPPIVDIFLLLFDIKTKNFFPPPKGTFVAKGGGPTTIFFGVFHFWPAFF